MTTALPMLRVSPWEMLKSSSWGSRFKLIWSSVRLGRDPERTEEVFNIAELFICSSGLTKEAMAQYASEILAQPGMREIFEARYMPKAPVIEELRKLPVGTLGREFAEHMLKHNLSVDFYPKVEVVDAMSYLTMRARQTHDILHVLTGFGTSEIDEIGLQAFEAAQINSPLSGGIIGGGLVRASLMRPWEQRQILEATIRGYQMGQNAKMPVLAYRYEDNWEKSISQVREELGLS